MATEALVTLNPYVKRGERDLERKVFTVRTSGSVSLYGPEIEVLDTVEFQRLAGIKQLGTSYFVFRGAVHSRFEHALGAVHAAQRIIDIVNRNPYAKIQIGPDETRLIRLFALLHDLPHVPFGHTLEDEFALLERHDKNTARIDRLLWDSRIGEILRDALTEKEYETLQAMIAARDDEEIASLGKHAFCVDVVANTVCADALDYVQRDLEACGMPVELGERFLEYFIVTGSDEPNATNSNRMALVLEKRGMPRPDVESEVVKLLSYRYELAERVYFHHAKNAASVMIGRAVQALGLHRRDENFDFLTDELLLEILAKPAIAELLGVEVAPESDDERALATELGRMLKSRDLYKIAYLGVADDFGVRGDAVWDRWGSPEGRRELEDLFAALAGLKPGHVLVHLLRPKMAEKPADVRVVTTDKTVARLDQWDKAHSGRVAALNEAHRRLWRIAVYVHPATGEEDVRLVRLAAEHELGVPSRYVETTDDRYLEAVFDRLASSEGFKSSDRLALSGHARGESARPESLGDAEDRVRALVEAHREAREGEATRDGK